MVTLLGNKYTSSLLTVVFLMSSSISIIGQIRPWPGSLPEELLGLDISTRIRVDQTSISQASVDFGMMRNVSPAAVLSPSDEHDIASLVRLSYSSERPFAVAARGHGHSTRGQASASDGVVVEMRALNWGEGRINVSTSNGSSLAFVDAGGEQLWVDVLRRSLKYGLAPRSWTDYLHLTVGGTLSNAGISGQAFRYGPQISNVYELEVITGKGEKVTCSEDNNSDLFHAVLGGLGQFGIITRARIALEPAPQHVKWVRLMYTEFEDFTRDQEYLISLPIVVRGDERGFDYVEGSLFMGQSPINSWRSSFFSRSDLVRINSLVTKQEQRRGHRTLYYIEGYMHYNNHSRKQVNKELQSLLEDLNFAPGFVFTNDVPYEKFLDRVHEGEEKLKSKGLWEVPHPWLNIFIPKSRISDFNKGVFTGILKNQKSKGPILVFPMNRKRWNEKMTAVLPEDEEEIFYSIGFLRSAIGDLQELEAQNSEILSFCQRKGIRVKQYMPHYKTRQGWIEHFGSKWSLFLERKMKYDPKGILSPGQGIFSLQDQILSTKKSNQHLDR